jgi:hypothetical protein
MSKRMEVISCLRDKKPELETLLTVYTGKKSVTRFIKLFTCFTARGDVFQFNRKGFFSKNALQRLSLNIGAFFLGPFYLLYRKLYLSGILFLVTSVIITYISVKLSVKAIYLLNIAVMLAVFPHVNALFLKKFCDNLAEAGYGVSDFQFVLGYMKASGGINRWAIGGGIVYLTLFLSMTVMIFSGYISKIITLN